MKELDFDELDKAVNSLMSKSDISSNEDSTQISVNTISPSALVTSSNASPVAKPVSLGSIPVVSLDDASDSITPSLSEVVEHATPPVVSVKEKISGSTIPLKRSGRFMDLVPSSSESLSPMKAPTSRQGVTLTPVNQSVVPEKSEVQPEPLATPVSQPTPSKKPISRPPLNQSVSPLAASMSMSNRTKHADMPDPLDLHPQSIEGQKSAPEPIDEPVKSSSDAPSEFIETPSVATEPAPVSPFLSDTKVDKRPLGNASNSSSGPSPIVLDAELQSAPVASAHPELTSDLLAVESDQSNIAPTPAVARPNPELVSPISIAQQYRQQPRTGDQSHAAVYDTAAHPVAHSVKKKSHLLIGIAIAFIVLILGGGTAVLFYLGYI